MRPNCRCMPDHQDYRSFEEEFGQRLSELGNLYGAPMPEDEVGFQCPILSELRAQKSHYVDPRQISAGGEKRIFTVRDVRMDRLVVMAKPLREGGSDLLKEQFLREARVTACLQHPNVLSAYDIGVDVDDEPFFTMEFVQGDTLKDVVDACMRSGHQNRADSELDRLLAVFVKVCDGLAYAHSRGVLHLDIKPSNITIGPYGEALLCDWGLARVLPDRESEFVVMDIDVGFPDADILNDITLTGVIKGTPDFMAPEQGRPQGAVSEHTDIYSLGAVLYYILTGRAPVKVASSTAAQRASATDGLVPPSEVAGKSPVPVGLEAVAMKALSLRPEERYQSVADLRDEIERYRTGFATRAQEAGAWTLLSLLVQRKRTAFIVGAFCLVLLVAGGLTHMVRLAHQREVAIEAQHAAEAHEQAFREQTAVALALADDIRTTAMDMINSEDFLNASGKIKALQSHLSRETNPEDIQTLKEYLALLHFVKQDYASAAEYFSEVEVHKRYNALVTVAEEYAHVHDSDQINSEQFAAILIKLPRHLKGVAYYSALYYFKDHRNMPADQALPVVHALLGYLSRHTRFEQRRNPLELVETEQGWHLLIGSSEYNRFQMPISTNQPDMNVLSPLNLYALSLSESVATDLEELGGLKLKEVNLGATRSLRETKAYMFKRIEAERIIHRVEESDGYLKAILPDVELVRERD